VNGFINHLYTPLGTKSNYSAIANLHTLQITTAPVKPFFSLLCHSEDSSASRPKVHLSQPPMQNSCQLSTATIAPSPLSLPCRAQLTGRPNYSAISSQPPLQSSTNRPPQFLSLYNFPVRTGRTTLRSPAECAAVAAGTRSPSRCPETDLIQPPISRSLHSDGYTRYNKYCYDTYGETNERG
jgi:hypothetical protein